MNKTFASITVLNDGETFTTTTDCVVCQYDDEAAGADGFFDDADEMVDLVTNGIIKGRILSIDALVNLYDLCQASMNQMPDLGKTRLNQLPLGIREAVAKVQTN